MNIKPKKREKCNKNNSAKHGQIITSLRKGDDGISSKRSEECSSSQSIKPIGFVHRKSCGHNDKKKKRNIPKSDIKIPNKRNMQKIPIQFGLKPPGSNKRNSG